MFSLTLKRSFKLALRLYETRMALAGKISLGTLSSLILAKCFLMIFLISEARRLYLTLKTQKYYHVSLYSDELLPFSNWKPLYKYTPMMISVMPTLN
jgi:hypothetical protein